MKPRLLLHICCAPDEAFVVKTLNENYELSCFFCNPNIAPPDEYDLRLNEAKKVAEHFNVPFAGDPYEPDAWETAVRHVKDTKEGGERCRHCFLLRLRRTATFAVRQGIPSFTTVMSISPHKSIDLLNECGAVAARESGTSYEPFDFKKKDGFKKSVSLSKELGLYRQDYCGCRLSKVESTMRKLAAR